MRDRDGREIDIHSFELDAQGNNIFGVAYRAEHLTGSGRVLDCRVRCIPAEWTVRFHIGYPLDANDFRDVKALCDTFGIEMPEEHKAHWERNTGR
jgi:lincosamide nucleotidyltransferase A/C/D/E